MRIALAQIRSGTEPEANLKLVEDYTRRAADAGASLVLFPEATMCRFGVSLSELAEPLDGPWADGVRRIASSAGITVIAGMFVPADDGRVTNTLIASGPGVGLSLCDDIRFPELYVELARRGAQLITVHASWGSGPGKLEQWTLLARARALDTGSFVGAVGQAYPGDEVAKLGPTGVGGSIVASPYGEVVDSVGAEPSLLVSDIDTGAVQSVRDTIAVLRNRTDLADAHRAESRA